MTVEEVRAWFNDAINVPPSRLMLRTMLDAYDEQAARVAAADESMAALEELLSKGEFFADGRCRFDRCTSSWHYADCVVLVARRAFAHPPSGAKP